MIDVPEEFLTAIAPDMPPCASTDAGDTPADRQSLVQKMNMTEAPPLLVGRKAPQYVRQQELPWHRAALHLAAKGYTAKEVAAKLGVSPVTVQDILRQPHLQAIQVAELKRVQGEDENVVLLIKENVTKAVSTLAEICNDKNARNGDRIAAANAILDRRYGKPNQPLNRNTDIDLGSLSDAELAAMLDTHRGN